MIKKPNPRRQECQEVLGQGWDIWASKSLRGLQIRIIGVARNLSPSASRSLRMLRPRICSLFSRENPGWPAKHITAICVINTFFQVWRYNKELHELIPGKWFCAKATAKVECGCRHTLKSWDLAEGVMPAEKNWNQGVWNGRHMYIYNVSISAKSNKLYHLYIVFL